MDFVEHYYPLFMLINKMIEASDVPYDLSPYLFINPFPLFLCPTAAGINFKVMYLSRTPGATASNHRLHSSVSIYLVINVYTHSPRLLGFLCVISRRYAVTLT
jgi:hypothetical protein